MLKIEVTPEVRTVTWAAKPGRDAGSMQVQVAYAHVPGQKYPQRIEVMPKRGDPVYPPGDYTFDSSSFYVDQHGKLAFGLKLVLMQAGALRKVG
jgi:hypothetical protein